jgi:RHS repeat-associated protein
MEKDDEWKGSGNSYDFGARGYDPRLGMWLSVDPKTALLPHVTPYNFALNNPINIIDPDGEFPILVNGKVGGDNERGSSIYWNSVILDVVSLQTGYSKTSFKYVDGDQGSMPSSRAGAGAAQGKLDAQGVWETMKKSMNKAGQITEQLQIITHSRGSVYGAAYMASLSEEIKNIAKNEGIGFAYDKSKIIEYSVNLAPHQSNWIDYPEGGGINVNISHQGDVLSGNDATGNVLNIHSSTKTSGYDSHGNGTFVYELTMVLKSLESSSSQDNAFAKVISYYKNYDLKYVSATQTSFTLPKKK